MNHFVLKLGVIVLLTISCLNICLADEIVINAVTNASDNPDEGWKKGRKLSLKQGVWEIRAVSGGWSCWSSNRKRSPDVKGAWTWNLYIKIQREDRSFCFGVCSDWWRFSSENEADTFVKTSVEPLLITLNEPSDVYFWIYDDGSKSDNRGKLTIDIKQSK